MNSSSVGFYVWELYAARFEHVSCKVVNFEYSSFEFVMPGFWGAPHQVPIFLPIPWLEDFWSREALWFRIHTAGTTWLKVMNFGRSNFSSHFSHNQYGQSLFFWVADFYNSPFYLPSRVKVLLYGVVSCFKPHVSWGLSSWSYGYIKIQVAGKRKPTFPSPNPAITLTALVLKHFLITGP